MAKKKTFHSETLVDTPLDKAFEWYQNPGTFQRLSPPFAPIEVQGFPSLKNDEHFSLAIKVLGMRVKWLARIVDFKDRESFSDLQVKGPFNFWLHKHSFQSPNPQTTKIIDKNRV